MPEKNYSPQGSREILFRSLILLSVAFCLSSQTMSYGLDLTGVVSGLQKRYASVETVAGDFRQTYRAPGIDQVESGVFRLKRPALMRWEYRDPEEKLFVADGRNAYLYVPQDRQVTEQPFSASDLHNTPLEFMLGSGDIDRGFVVSWELDFKPSAGSTYLIRLTPRKNRAEYSFLVLELDQKTFDVQRIVIREPLGNTSEFLFTNVTTNVKIASKEFQFKPPKGVEVLQLTNE